GGGCALGRGAGRALSLIHGPGLGGAHNRLVRLRRARGEGGSETGAALPAAGEGAAARLEEAGIEVHLVALGRLRASVRPGQQIDFWRRVGGDVRRLAGLVSRNDSALVQVHGIHNPQAAIAGRRRGAAVVWQLPDTRAPMALRRAPMPVVRSLADALVPWGRQ